MVASGITRPSILGRLLPAARPAVCLCPNCLQRGLGAGLVCRLLAVPPDPRVSPETTTSPVGPAGAREYCRLDDAGKSLPVGPAIGQARLRAAISQLGMSARPFRRIPLLCSGQA